MTKIAILLIPIFLSLSIKTNGQETSMNDLTAKEILLKCLDFNGGISRMDSVKNIEHSYSLTLDNDSLVSIITKKRQGKNFMASTLTEEYANTSIFSERVAVVLTSDKIEKVEDKQKLDELELQTYILPEYGYYKLNYKLERLKDQAFKNFDCLVVQATSSNGYYTLNYFDKVNFRLIMIIYSNEQKTLLTDFIFKEGILTHTQILHVNEHNQISEFQLTSIRLNKEIEPEWFMIPKKILPLSNSIKEGKFVPLHDPSVELIRTKDQQTETFNKGKSRIVTSLKWMNDYVYKLTHSNTENSPGNLKPGDSILVKIIYANKKKYLCHYTSKYGSGTNVYLKIK
jgi:hypothetical protein